MPPPAFSYWPALLPVFLLAGRECTQTKNKSLWGALRYHFTTDRALMTTGWNFTSECPCANRAAAQTNWMSCNVNCSGNQLIFCSKIVVTAWVADIGLACVAFSRGGTIEQRAEAKTALSQSFGRHRWHLAPNRENNFLNRGHLSRTFMWHFSYHTKEGKIKEKWLWVEHLLNYSIKLPLKLGDQKSEFFLENIDDRYSQA